MADHWYVVVPDGTNQGGALTPTHPGNTQVVKVAVGSPADTAWNNNGSYQGWTVYQGPFNSEAEARASSPPSGLGALWDLTTTVAGTVAANANPANPLPNVSTPNPLAGLEGIAKVLGDIGRALTDGKMWRSFGWVTLGILILMLGIGLWLGEEAVKAIGPSLPLAGRFL